MQHKLYSILDTKLTTYDAPFPSANKETAMRLFKRMLDNIPTMQDNPSDFQLYLVGSYDIESAKISHCTLQQICSGLDLVKNPTIKQTLGNRDETPKVSHDTPIQPSS